MFSKMYDSLTQKWIFVSVIFLTLGFMPLYVCSQISVLKIEDYLNSYFENNQSKGSILVMKIYE